jgi:hypothetical protein
MPLCVTLSIFGLCDSAGHEPSERTEVGEVDQPPELDGALSAFLQHIPGGREVV